MALRDQFIELARKSSNLLEGTYAGGNGLTHEVYIRDLGRNVTCSARGDTYLPGQPVAVGRTTEGGFTILNLSQRQEIQSIEIQDFNEPKTFKKPVTFFPTFQNEQSLRPIVFPSVPTLQAVRYMYQQLQTNSQRTNVSNPFQVPIFDIDPNFRNQWGFDRNSGAYWIENVIEVESNLESPETWSRSQIIPGAGLVPTELTLFREASRVTLAVLPTVGGAGGAANLIPPPNLLNYNITILRRSIGVLGETLLRSLKTFLFNTHNGNSIYRTAIRRKPFILTNAGGAEYLVDGVPIIPSSIPPEPVALEDSFQLTTNGVTFRGMMGYSPSFEIRYELPGYDTAGDNRDKTNASILRGGEVGIRPNFEQEGIQEDRFILFPYEVQYVPERQQLEDARAGGEDLQQPLIDYLEYLFPDFAGRFDVAPNYPFQNLIDDFPVELWIRAGGLNLIRLDTLPIRPSSAYEFLWLLGGHLVDLDFTGKFFRTPELQSPVPLIKVLGVQPWIRKAFVRVFQDPENEGEEGTWEDAFMVDRPDETNTEDLYWVRIGQPKSGRRFELFIEEVYESQRFGFPPKIELLTQQSSDEVLIDAGFDNISFSRTSDSDPGYVQSPTTHNENEFVPLNSTNWTSINHDILMRYSGQDFEQVFGFPIEDNDFINNLDYFFHPDPVYEVNSPFYPFENQYNDIRIRGVWF